MKISKLRNRIHAFYNYCFNNIRILKPEGIKEFNRWNESEIPKDLLDKYNKLKKHIKNQKDPYLRCRMID